MEEPKLAHRRKHHNSTIRSGRTIGEQRERIETANERAAARKKDKRKATRRVLFTIAGFVLLTAMLFFLASAFFGSGQPNFIDSPAEMSDDYHPTIEIIDNDADATSGKITTRMATFIGQVERDFRELGLNPTKAVVPSGSIREVDFYLDGYSGFIKMTIDRGSAVSVEDTDRLLRYLAGQDITDFQYLDVRLSGRAYWK